MILLRNAVRNLLLLFAHPTQIYNPLHVLLTFIGRKLIKSNTISSNVNQCQPSHHMSTIIFQHIKITHTHHSLSICIIIPILAPVLGSRIFSHFFIVFIETPDLYAAYPYDVYLAFLII